MTPASAPLPPSNGPTGSDSDGPVWIIVAVNARSGHRQRILDMRFTEDEAAYLAERMNAHVAKPPISYHAEPLEPPAAIPAPEPTPT